MSHGKRFATAALAALALGAGAARAEDRSARNSIFVEGLGPGLAYSVNYERLVLDDVGLRAGFSYLSLSGSGTSGSGTTGSASVSWYAIPLTVSYLGIGSGNHALEIGAGATLINAGGSAKAAGVTAVGSGTATWGTAFLGYRRQPPDGGFQFRIGAAALFGEGLSLNPGNPTAVGVIPWFYLSLGAAF